MKGMRLLGFGDAGEESLPQKLLVAVPGRANDRRTLELACEVAMAVGAEIEAVHVLELPRSVSTDDPNPPGMAQAEAAIANAKTIMTDAGIEGAAQVIRSHQVAKALLQRAEDTKVDVIVMEAGRRKGIGVALMGDNLDIVLRNAQCGVWAVRFPEEG